MGRDVTKSMGRVVWHMFFFHFALHDGLIASKVILMPCTKLIVRVSKVILMPCTKLIVRVSYLFAIF